MAFPVGTLSRALFLCLDSRDDFNVFYLSHECGILILCDSSHTSKPTLPLAKGAYCIYHKMYTHKNRIGRDIEGGKKERNYVINHM